MLYYYGIKDSKEYSKISDEEKEKLEDTVKLLDSYSYSYRASKLEDFTYDELRHIFEIAKICPKLQIEMWCKLTSNVADKPENIDILEDILENKFGEYIQGIDKKRLTEVLNGSRQPTMLVDDKGIIVHSNVALLEQMNSSLFENPDIKEAFSFEQLLEIVSVEDTERGLKSILTIPNSREILISIGKDFQSWQAKLQYLINLKDGEKKRIIKEFGSDGKSLINEEINFREKCFSSIEQGYFEDEEYGETFEIEIEPNSILNATFGISYDEAKEIMKKYGIDTDKLDIQTAEDRKIHRKLQIIKELTTSKKFYSYEEEKEYYENYYYANKEELLEISKDISVFYKVDLEKDFLDLYARQYDRALGVQATKKENVDYDGKSIPVYEASGDFMILIRGEQNVSPEHKKNFWNATQVGIKGLCQCTISQDYIRPVNYGKEDTSCFIASTSCKDGELRMASTTNIKSKKANIALSNLGVKSDYGNGVILRIPQEQINNSRGVNNETDTTRSVYNSETRLYERKSSEYIVYIQDTNDVDIEQEPQFKTAKFAASQTDWPILVIPREKCAQREEDKIQELKERLLGNKERLQGENDESIIKELIVKFNNNREGILTSKGLREKYFTESEHIELVGIINARLSQLMETHTEQYESLVQTVSKIYKDEIDKYYAFSYDRDDAQKQLDIDITREHLKPYEDFLVEHERNLFDLSNDEKQEIYDTIRNISKTPYYNMNEHHSLTHIQKVIMFSGILARNENLSHEDAKILLIAAAFHDSGRNGKEGEDDNHAIESAKQVQRYFEDNPNNPFGITLENSSIIQAAIEYHEHKEKEEGVTDREKLYDLSCKYGIDYERFESLVKISELLKDADALDRARFGKRNEKRWSLDTRYLKSDTAKSISMLRFSEECNFKFKEEKAGDLDKTIEILEGEINEFSRQKIQMSSVKQVTYRITANQKQTTINDLKEIQIGAKEIFEENSMDKG